MAEAPKMENPVFIPLEGTIKELEEADVQDKHWRRYGVSYDNKYTLSPDERLDIRQRIEAKGKWWCLVEQSIDLQTGFAYVVLSVKPRI